MSSHGNILDFHVEEIHSPSDVRLLDDIDELRSNGVNHLVALPQLIVCGDQSSGKSSVLEAISGIPFPTKDNLCTRFATEVVLRRASQEEVRVTIQPELDRDTSSRAQLRAFDHSLSDWTALGDVIDLATTTMGLNDSARAFTNDVLRIDISGPRQPHLTIVDLPGLIHSHGRSQTAEDVEIVQQLVRRYMMSERSIILAIVSAKNDYANQIVLKMAREVDAQGVRTLGVVTKPDTLPIGSESEAAYVALAKNQEIPFLLGWHVLKNRDHGTKSYSLAERNTDEMAFLNNGVWAELPRSDVAIDALRRRLSRVLLTQIRRELPNLLREVETKLGDCQMELRRMGEPRNSENQQRRFLLKLSQEYTSLCRAAVDGVYRDPFFGDSLSEVGYQRRIRAVIQNLSIQFADSMRRQGHRYNVLETDKEPKTSSSVRDQLVVTRRQYLAHAKLLLTRSRGCELPGTFNPMLIADLFQEQCSPWRNIMQKYLDSTFAATRAFSKAVINHLVQSEVAQPICERIIDPRMALCKQHMKDKLDSLLSIYQRDHPITYNHYFTETIQSVRAKRVENELAMRLQTFLVSQGVHDGEELNLTKSRKNSLITAMSKTNEADMDRYACGEAVDCMFAYYKTAIKTVIDNMATQCVEGILMRCATEMFSPSLVLDMDAIAVQRIACESDKNAIRRDQLISTIKLLECGLETCRRHVSSSHAEDFDTVARCNAEETISDHDLIIQHDDSPYFALNAAPEQVQGKDGLMTSMAADIKIQIPGRELPIKNCIPADESTSASTSKKKTKAKQ